MKASLKHGVNLSTPTKKVLYILLFALVFVLYGNTLGHQYNFDDDLVTNHHPLSSRGIEAIPEIFNSHYYQDKDGYAYEYRPVVLSSFAIEHQFFGDNPQISHLVNVSLYAILALTLFGLLNLMLPGLGLHFSLLATVLFILHPIHTEVVASIKSRDEILALLLGLASWILAIRFFIKGNILLALLSTFFLVLGLLSKMSIVSLVVLIPLSAVFFKDVKYLRLILLSILFTISSVYIISFVFGETRLLFTFLIAAITGPTLVYYLLKENIVQKLFKRFDFLWSKESGFRERLSVIGLSFKSYIQKHYITTSIILIAIHLLGVLFDVFKITTPTTLIITFLLLYFSDKEFKKYFLVLLYALLISIYLFSITKLIVKTSAFFIVLLFISGHISRNKHTSLIIFLIAISTTFFIGFAAIGLIIALIGYLYFDRNKILYLLSLLYFIYFIIKLFVNPYEDAFDYVFLLIAGILPLLYSKVKLQKIADPILILSFCFFTIYATGFYSIPKTSIEVAKQMIETQTETTPRLLENTDRPLDFLEYPMEIVPSANIKIGTAAYLLGEYLKKLLLPVSFGFYYGYAQVIPVGMDNFQAIMSVITYALLLIMALFYAKKHITLSYSIVFFITSILVFSNLFYPVAGMMGDRLAFVSSLGYCMVLAYIPVKLFKVFNLKENNRLELKPIFIFISILILGFYSFKTISRNSQWKDPLTLMQYDIKYLDKSAQAHNILAGNLFNEYNKSNNEKYLDQAIHHYEKAIDIYPEFFNAYYSLGDAYKLKKEYKKSVLAFNKVIELDSSYTSAMISIANIYEMNGVYKYAIPYYELAINNNPGNVLSYNSLAYAWFRLNEYNKAIDVVKQAVNKFPNDFDTWSNLGKIYLQIGDSPNAITSFEKAFSIDMNVQVALILSDLYREQGNIEKALYYQSFSN